MKSENEDLYRSLVILLKMFKSRPYHLAKYLVENSALTKEFIEKIKNSDKLKEISEDEKNEKVDIYFSDISQMENFFTSLVDESSNGSRIEDLTKELNEKLNKCIKQEKYEDAARIRDYMIRNRINRN